MFIVMSFVQPLAYAKMWPWLCQLKTFAPVGKATKLNNSNITAR